MYTRGVSILRLFYLCGIDQEDTVLVLFPDCPIEKYRETLLIRKTDEAIAVWEGQKLTKKLQENYLELKMYNGLTNMRL